MAKDLKKDLMGIGATHAIKEALAGHLAPLIGRFRSGVPLTSEERQFIAAALEQLEGKRGKAEMRRLEKELVRWRVEGLQAEGWKLEAAVRQEKEKRGYSRSFVFDAMKAAKESKKRK